MQTSFTFHVELTGGKYAFFEVTGLDEEREIGQPQTNAERDKNSEILGSSSVCVGINFSEN
jgi:hypothetical protein